MKTFFVIILFALGAMIVYVAVESLNPIYEVQYDANGATSGSNPSDPKVYRQGSTVTVLGNSRSLRKAVGDENDSSYVFLGWNTQPDGSGDSYHPGDTFILERTKTDLNGALNLYAVWVFVPSRQL
jgi:hypothetical protein